MIHTSRRARLFFLFSVVLTWSLLASGVTPSSAQAPADERQGPDAPVADEVRAELAEKGQATFWIHFEQQPQFAGAASTTDWGERGERVMSALRANAETSQADVRALLTEAGVDFKAFWAVNAIQVT